LNRLSATASPVLVVDRKMAGIAVKGAKAAMSLFTGVQNVVGGVDKRLALDWLRTTSVGCVYDVTIASRKLGLVVVHGVRVDLRNAL
jgi:hypothetical protein